ncbi:hypothetical protein [Ralstonia solanacearum]|uniref:hypothetical protein n=1 Tax=Ralstonia solanacearum TaxID=305 RepID=UPI0013C35837|nr:hypothetical protein [Ralstonia solanacearum]
MKSTPRDPEKFAPLEMLDALATHLKVPLNEVPSCFSLPDYVKQANGAGTLLHGKRAEIMFKYVVASLGQAVFIEQVDAAALLYAGDPVQAPDYFIQLVDGERFYVEVKNCQLKSWSARVTLKVDYVRRLQEYCRIKDAPLLLAIYWVGVQRWTLNRLEPFLTEAGGVSIRFQDAMLHNAAAMIGDRMLSTVPPLACTLLVDREREQTIENGVASLVFKRAVFTANGKEITNDRERGIANYLMLFSRWIETRYEVIWDGGQVDRIEVVCEPHEVEQPRDGQPFANLGTLAGMVSAAFNAATVQHGKIVRLTPLVEPSALVSSVDDEYRGEVLGLWIFRQSYG